MIIGCPKEIKSYENRVGLIPSSVKMLKSLGHEVIIETHAGNGSNITDEQYIHAGAKIAPNSHEVWQKSQMIVKVKEPLKEEFELIQNGQIIFTFLHLAAEEQLAKELIRKKTISIAYETIIENDELPILKPMSEIAGRMSAQMGAFFLTNHHGGKGLLLSGSVGVKKGQVVILGAGVVGKNAARMALGLGAKVAILDINLRKLEEIDDIFNGQVQTIYSTPLNIANWAKKADILIGAVLINGDKAPKLVTKEMIKTMEKGSVVVDVAIDQGGCVETIKRTTHEQPVYDVDGVIHYGVANMPGDVPMTSTFALAHASFRYLKMIAESKSVNEAILKHPTIASGLNTHSGFFTNQAVAKVFNQEYKNPVNLF